MVILKNCTKFLENPEFFQTFLQNKEPSCILYSKEGKKFNIHKEILYQSNLMKNVLISSNNFCCKDIEIFCPCTEEEVRQMVNFLYTGTISYTKQSNVYKFMETISEIFGFPEEFFSVEKRSKFEMVQNSENKEELKNIIKKPIETEETIEIFDEQSNALTLESHNSMLENQEQDPLTTDVFKDGSLNTDVEMTPLDENSEKGKPGEIFDEQNDIEKTDPKYFTTALNDNVENPEQDPLNSEVLEEDDNLKTVAKIIPSKSTSSKLKRNLNNHSDNSLKEKKPFVCGFCDEIFKTITAFEKHVLSVHEGKTPKNSFACNLCGEGFEKKNDFVDHVFTVHDGQKPFQCKFCDKIFIGKENLKSHKSINHPYQCNDCEKRFIIKRHLNEHNSKHHVWETYKCETCRICYISKERLRMHVKTVHQINSPNKGPAKCNLCQKEYCSTKDMRKHILEVHEDKRPHGCSICNRHFKRKVHLRDHSSLPHVHPCKGCDLKFVFKGQLMKHNSIVHGNDKRKYVKKEEKSAPV